MVLFLKGPRARTSRSSARAQGSLAFAASALTTFTSCRSLPACSSASGRTPPFGCAMRPLGEHARSTSTVCVRLFGCLALMPHPRCRPVDGFAPHAELRHVAPPPQLLFVIRQTGDPCESLAGDSISTSARPCYAGEGDRTTRSLHAHTNFTTDASCTRLLHGKEFTSGRSET